MSSMTIDQLKKSLTEQGITLPPSRSKKADYVKLYKQYSTINDSLGDVYSSDDENPPRTGSQNVSSTSSPSKSDNIAREVEQLSDDELYHKLKEFDDKIGPVLKNTRRVYEKKLIKILSTGKQTNGYEASKIQMDKFTPPVDEFSDSDVEVISQSVKKAETKGRKSSVLRESPKPSSPEPSFKSDTVKPFTSSYDYNRSSTPGYSAETKSSRFSYIETIPRGSSFSYIEPDADVSFSDTLRQRFSNRYDGDKLSSDKFSADKFGSDKFSSDKFGSDKFSADKFGSDKFSSDKFGSDKFSADKFGSDQYEKYMTNKLSTDDVYKPNIGFKDQFKSGIGSQFKSSLGGGDYKSGLGTSGQYKSGLGVSNQYKTGGFGETYTGTWEPNISRYLGTGAQRKLVPNTKTNYSSFWWKLLAALLLLGFLLLLIYIYHQWSITDPYKMIEDDAERKIQELSEGSGN